MKKVMKKALAVFMLFMLVVPGIFTNPAVSYAKSAKKVTKVVITAPADKTLVLKKGKSYSLKVKVTPSDAANKAVSYTTSNKKVVSVTQTGKVKALKAGTAVITVKAKDSSKKSASLKVIVGNPVTRVTLNKKSSEMEVGDKLQLKAVLTPKSASLKKVTWTSSNSKAASVNSSGLVSAKGTGNAVITAAAADGSGKKASCKIKVGNPVTDISLNYGNKILTVGDTFQLEASLVPENAAVQEISWSSSNPDTASVSSDGTVTANKEGTAVITVKSMDTSGKTASCSVSIEKKPVSVPDTAGGNNPGGGDEEDEYTLMWSDDFNGGRLDAQYWNYELHEPGWVNNELQEYTDSPDNIYVEEGNLVIKANKTVEGASTSYTSGKVTTQNKVDFTYGKAEARIKVPEGQGLWPAFWMMPANEQFYGTWPLCGEIDIMEILGHETNKLYGTIHYGNPHKESQGAYVLSNGKFSDDYHVYGVEWKPGSIEFYIDGVLFHSVNNWYTKVEGKDEITYPAPFDQNFFLQLNLAVGGNWPGNPDETTNFDNARMLVDYVKVYRMDSYDENVTKPELEFREPDATGNYVYNGDFSGPLSAENWEFLNAAGGGGTAVTADNTLRIESSAQGSQLYSVQLVQAGLPMYRGGDYRLTFQAKADDTRDMVVDISAPDNNWVRYLPDTQVSLTTGWQNYSFDFTMSGNDDPNGRLEFNFGAQGSLAVAEIRDVRLVKTAQAEIPEEEKTVQPDGNYVYNGEFQVGTDRMKYWEVLNNLPQAVVSVTNANGVRELKAAVPEASGNIGDLIVKQPGLAIVPGKEYQLSFDAYSTENKDIKVTIDGQEFSASLTADKQKYTFEFTSNSPLTGKDLELLLGAAGTTYIDNVKLKEAGMVINGEFDNGMVGWEMFADASISSMVSSSVAEENGNNAMEVSIQDTGDAEWKIQLKQNHIGLLNGKWYKLSLDAKSDISRQLMFALQRDGSADDDWNAYSGTDVVTLGSSYQTFEKTFLMTSATDLQTILSISMGAVSGNRITNPHKIWIDNVILEEVEEPGGGSDPVPPGINLIQNSNFAAGDSNWTMSVTAPGEATTSFAGNAATINVTNAGTANWNVQLKQGGIRLAAGKTYDIAITLESTVSRQIDYCCMSTDGNYTYYGGDGSAVTANTPVTLTKSFTMSAADDAAELVISLGETAPGTPPGSIRITEVVVLEPSGGSTPEPAGGNLIKNSNFAEGNADWTLAVTAPGEATASYSVTGAAIDITNAGTANWNVQLKQSGLNLEAGKTYSIEIKLESTVSRQIDYSCMSTDSSQWYGGGDLVVAANTPSTLSAAFTMTSGDAAADFIISLGKTAEGTPAGIVIVTSVIVKETE